MSQVATVRTETFDHQHSPVAANTVEPQVSIRKLSKTYHLSRGDLHALKEVSLDIMPGEIVVLLGPSGCGKTTLLRSIAGLEAPTSGEIQVRGNTVYCSERGISLPPEKRNLSMVFQSYALWPHMTVFQNIAYPLKISKVSAEETEQRVRKALGVAGLEKFSSNFPGQLSGGQQQRVALARALVANDGLILFDEPLSNLDAKVRERLRDELLSMQAEFGFTGIYVTHDQVEAAALANRIAVMEVGQVAQLGTPHQVFNEPQSRYIADFVGCSNELPGTLVGVRDGVAEVDSPIGRMVGMAALPNPKAGQNVRLMFRPEHGRVREAGVSTAANSFTATVGRAIFMGSHTEYHLDVAGRHMLLRSMRPETVRAGQPATISVDPAVMRVFPGD